jgi:tRNA pseudouridine38-40 synthase
MRNLRLLIEYDGTDFVGWQIQANGRSVQGEITRVLEQVLHEMVNLIGAGRTDAGVHARGQTANFRTSSSMTPEAVHEALNGVLPEDIRVHAVAEVAEEFHARFDAKQRRYSYTISTVPAAIGRRYSWQLRRTLDIGAMQRASSATLGTHSFAAFCKKASDKDHHQCTVVCSEWRAEPGRLVYSVAANRFLHGMVRALVGTMVDVGRGYTPEEEFSRILAGGDRSAAGMAAPARGLVLEEVVY